MEKHVNALTGVRGVAVLTVFLAHLQQRYFNFTLLDGTAISAANYFGITIFFVLSGFVIHWNYARLFETELPPVAGWRFFVARFSRLWPLHFAVSLLAFVVWLDFPLFLQHVFMVQLWVFQGSPNISNFNTWSISSEWFFYFAYAFGYPLLSRIRFGSMWALTIVVSAAFAIYWVAGPTTNTDGMWLRYYAPYMRLLEFFTGVVAAQVVMTRRAEDRPLPSDLLWIAVLGLTVILYDSALGRQTTINYLVAPLVAVLLVVVSNSRTFAAKWLSARWLLWIGDRSYSIYLLEAVFLVFTYRLELRLGLFQPGDRVFTWAGCIAGIAMSLFALALVLTLSDLCWRRFEMPARTAIKRVLAGTRLRVKPANSAN